MSGVTSLDGFDEGNTFKIEINTDDDTTARDTIHDTLTDRDEWESTIDNGILYVTGAGTDDGLRNLLTALTDIDPDTLEITDYVPDHSTLDTSNDTDSGADTGDSADSETEDTTSDQADRDDEDTTDDGDAEDPNDDLAEDEATEDTDDGDDTDTDTEDDPDTGMEEDVETTDENSDETGASEGDTDADTGNDTASGTDSSSDTTPAADTGIDVSDTDTPGDLLTAYVREHGQRVTAADTALASLDLAIEDPDDLLELLELPDRTAYVVKETGHDEDTVETLMDADREDLESELAEVTDVIDQLETLQSTGGDTLSALQPDDIEEELNQQQDRETDLTEKLDRLDSVETAVGSHEDLQEQADRITSALESAVDTIDNQMDVMLLQQDGTMNILFPGNADAPGALTAVTRTRIMSALDEGIGEDAYTVDAGTPMTSLTIIDDVSLSDLQEMIQESITDAAPEQLTSQIHTYTDQTM